MLDLLSHLGGQIDAHYAGPPGPMMDAVCSLGIAASELRGTTGSLRINRDTPSAVSDLARDGLKVAQIARRVGADVVMANSLRAGLMGVVAERVPGCPPHVVHIHDVLPDGRATAAINGLVRRGTTHAIANSRYTARHFAAEAGAVDAVYNPIDLERFDPDGLDRRQARVDANLPADRPLVGLVAQITPWKGQIDAIRAHALVRRASPRALLLLGGTAKFLTPGTRYDNRAYLEDLQAAAEQVEGGDSVRFLGERDDMPRLLRALDVLVMPSWEEPFGRVAVEAMAMGTAVVVTSVGGPPEYVEHGVTGMLAPPRQPEALAREIAGLLGDDDLRQRIGDAARRAVRPRFGVDRYRERVLDAFERAIRVSSSRPRGRVRGARR
jgi:glycosyltransferase involved in cell wall biosynthesis